MLLGRARGIIADAIFIVPIIFALPLAILVVGTPIVLLVRLLIEIVERI
jgi:hypothetical protein